MNYYENLKLPTKHWLTCIESINLKWVSLEKYSECAIVEHTCTCAQIIFNIDLHGESERERESDRNSWKMLKGGCRIFDVYRKNKHS